MYALAYVVYEPFALPILLLSGISTGLGTPFVVNLIGGQLPLVIGMIIITSVAVPFVLQLLSMHLFARSLKYLLLQMTFLLSIALFTPLAVGWLTKKYFPGRFKICRQEFFPSIAHFHCTHKLGYVCQVRRIFLFRTDVLAPNCGSSIPLLCCPYCIVGYAGTTGSLQEKRTGLIVTSYVNNVLVAVFAFQFFGSQVATLLHYTIFRHYIGIR